MKMTRKSIDATEGLDFMPRILLILLILCQLAGLPHAQENPQLQPDLFSVNFPTEQDGWACGPWGTVLHTGDGGTPWVHQNTGIGYTLSSIHFVDPRNGWAVGERGAIIRSKDGGKTWTKQESPVDYFLMQTWFSDERTGWIVTEMTTILHTENGGESWEVQHSQEDATLKAVSFCDSETGWAVGEFGYIYHTKDGGQTWQHQAGEFGFSEETGDIVSGNLLFDVIAIDPIRAWVVGIDGYVARTRDAGQTWHRVTYSFPKTQLFGIASDRQGMIVICGNGTLLVSSDEGESFRRGKIDPTITYGWLYGITHCKGREFVAVGKQGWIYKSDEAGYSWQR